MYTRLARTGLLLLCAGCAPDTLVDDLADARTSGHRFTLPHIEFNLWTDVLTLQAGLCEGSCTFLEPIADDHSTNWPPLQVSWVIYDDPTEVQDGDALFDTFWLGDELYADQFQDRDGLQPLGFQFVTPFYQGMVPIQSTELSDDGRTLTGTLGGGVDALIRAEATDTADGCVIDSTWCMGTDPDCDFQPFTSLYLELSALRTVQSFEFRP